MEERKPTKRHPIWWLLSITLPCLITSYASYRTSKWESEATASAGYQTLVESQKELQKALEDHIKADDKETVAQSAQLDFLRVMLLRLYNVAKDVHKSAELRRPINASPVLPVSNLPKFQSKSIPNTLGGAVKYQKMLEQQQITPAF